jgi:uncharacterized RDD family membrane protein YckC
MDMQNASVMKRLAAWLLDAILVCVLSVGFAVILSAVLRYDSHYANLQAGYDRYEQQYGVVLRISQEEYENMSESQRENYDAAQVELLEDEALIRVYNLVLSLTLVIATLSILLGVMTMEFVIPLLLKNGQTVGKKAFGIALVRVDGVKVSTVQLFVRSLLGKYTVETMIPVYILLMFFWNAMDMTGTVVLAGLAVLEIACIIVNPYNALIHDLMAGTVAVDISSQKIFSNTEELIEYTKRIHAERAQKQDY